MKHFYTSKRELSIASLLFLAIHLVCPLVYAMDLPMQEPSLLKTSQQHPIIPRDQWLVDFIHQHAPHKFDTIDKDRKTLDDYAQIIILGDSKYDKKSYGGPLGKEFFSIMETALLEEFCEKIKTVKASLPKKSVVSDNIIKTIFNDFLNTLGLERARLARITGTEEANLFGSRNFSTDNPGLMDVFDKYEPWPQWYQLLKAKTEAITQGMDLAKIYHCVQTTGKSFNIPYGNTTLEVTFAGHDKYGIYWRHSEDKSFDQAFKFNPFPRTGDQTNAYYWVLRGPNMKSLFPSDEKESITSYRKPGVGQPTPAFQDIISLGFGNFKNLLYWNGSFTDKLVIGHFSSLLWKMSQSSIFERGQAAITKWFLGSLAKVNGYELQFTDQWNARLNKATEDMQALLEFDREKFVNDCVAHELIKLKNIVATKQ